MATAIPPIGGLFARNTAAGFGTGFFDQLRAGFEDNSNAFGGLGLGLLAHRQNAAANPLGNIAQNWMYGTQIDAKERAAKVEQAEKEASRKATAQYIFNKGLTKTYEEAEKLPVAVQAEMIKKIINPDKPEYMEVNGQIVEVGGGRARPIFGSPGSDVKATDDMREYQQAVQQGYNGSFMDYQLAIRRSGATQVNVGEKLPAGYMWSNPEDPRAGVVPIPGGPAEQMPAELAARVGLAKDALPKLDAVEEAASAGELTGPLDWAQGQIGRGKQGELKRELTAGAEALTRMLTGAGMNLGEAKREASQYLPQLTDDASTLANKVQQLKRRLSGSIEESMKGRGGFTPPVPSVRTYNPATGRIE